MPEKTSKVVKLRFRLADRKKLIDAQCSDSVKLKERLEQYPTRGRPQPPGQTTYYYKVIT